MRFNEMPGQVHCLRTIEMCVEVQEIFDTQRQSEEFTARKHAMPDVISALFPGWPWETRPAPLALCLNLAERVQC